MHYLHLVLPSKARLVFPPRIIAGTSHKVLATAVEGQSGKLFVLALIQVYNPRYSKGISHVSDSGPCLIYLAINMANH